MNNSTINALGQKEAELVARLAYEEKNIVTATEIDTYLPADFPYRKQLVYRLKKKGILSPIKRGVYVFVPLEAVPTGRRISEFLIPPIFFPNDNYYIGYSTAFNYYNLTDQQFQTIYVLNSTRCMKKTIAGLSFKFVKVPANRLYGRQRITIKNQPVLLSSRERTLVDLIYFCRPVGGIAAAAAILRRQVMEKKCDVRQLIKDTIQFPNIKTRKIIGLNLEEIGVAERLLKPLEKSVRKTSVISLTESRRGTLNKRWKIIIHASPR